MSKQELMRLKLDYKKHDCNREENLYKIEMKKLDIERLEDQIKDQDEKLKEIATQIETMEG
jgi:hypothetical protein